MVLNSLEELATDAGTSQTGAALTLLSLQARGLITFKVVGKGLVDVTILPKLRRMWAEEDRVEKCRRKSTSSR